MTGNIFDYLDWRCDVPFAVDPFNEVDNLVLSSLAYTDFRGILSMDGAEASLESTCRSFFQRHTHGEILANTSFTAKAPLLMEKMLGGARYRDIRLCWYLDETETSRDMQFAAVTVLLPDQSAFIAFRGTDGTLVGWKEDFNLSFLPESEGQRRAVRYLNQVGAHVPGPLRTGGHSKGGNHAVYAAAFCEQAVRDRILEVYSNDAPGFREEVLRSEGYRRILPRVIRIIPETSVIGLLLSSSAAPRVVKSSQTGIFQHDGFSWMVSRNRFLPAELTKTSLLVEKSLGGWLDQMSEADRQSFTEILFSLFESTGAVRFSEINQQKLKSTEAILNAVRNMPKEKQQEILSCLQQLGFSGGQAVTRYLASRLLGKDL